MNLRKIGEVVSVNGYDGTIESIKFEDSETFYEVRFLKDGIIPPVMDIHESMIHDSGAQNPNKCPLCQKDWKVTEFRNQKWRDCLKCGKTEEQALEEAELGAQLDEKNEEPPDFVDERIDWGIF